MLSCYMNEIPLQNKELHKIQEGSARNAREVVGGSEDKYAVRMYDVV